MKRKMYMKVTRDAYQIPIYYADTIAELSSMCGKQRAAIERAIHSRPNKYKPKEFIVVEYSDHDHS